MTSDVLSQRVTEEIARLKNENKSLQAKLTQIAIVCADNADVSHPQLAIKFIRQIANPLRGPPSTFPSVSGGE